MASGRLASFPNMLLSLLNFVLFILSSVSLAPTFLLKHPPTSLGWALLIISCISLLSSFVGFYSRITRFCFVTHVTLFLASITGQVVGILALFTRESASLKMIKSPRDPKEAKVLIRLECGILVCMFTMQLSVLVLTFVVHSCWVKEYKGLEVEREEMTKKRSRKMARVQEESMENVTKLAEARTKELDEKMKNKYGQWTKTDFEG